MAVPEEEKLGSSLVVEVVEVRAGSPADPAHARRRERRHRMGGGAVVKNEKGRRILRRRR